MIEAEIENVLIDRLDAALKDAGVREWQTLGAWRPGSATEQAKAPLLVTVRVHPRAYETYTTPQASMAADVTVVARADSDEDGGEYMKAAAALQAALQRWQTSIDATCSDFAVEGFSPAGLRMDGGEAGLDRDSKLWTCSQALTIYGVVLS